MRRWLPFLGFVLLLSVFYLGLWHNPREVPSPLIGKPAVAFDLPLLGQPGQRFSPSQAAPGPWLLNIWASWCGECRREHGYLLELAAQGIALYGLNWKDDGRKAAEHLARAGNPYRQVAEDATGRAGIDWGVTGVPETFLIDAQGIIRAKHSGPLNPKVWERKFQPLLSGAGS